MTKMASINYKEIEQKLQKLKFNTDSAEIGYLILSAFGTSDTYIRRYKSGKGNMAKYDGILIKKSLAYQAASTLKLTDTLESMKSDESIAKQKVRIIAVSDGITLLAYDTKEKESYENKIDKVWLDFQFFFPLAGVEKFVLTEENPADVKAAVKMAKLHNEICRYNEFSSDADLYNLNVFMTRLLFCFFAEDTDIFEKGVFTDYIYRFTAQDGSDLSERLDELFNVMDEPFHIGQSKVLARFPYVNGGLFHHRIPIPKMGMRARSIIIESGELDWGDINPDIFGSMMQAVVTPELRGSYGMHYTSVPNIMKVIQPLFLNDLENAFADAFDNAKKLDALLIRISQMKFFDPACGSGNFLIITYKELRRLEIRIWQRITELSGLRIIPFTNISISQFYGIELDSFAHEIAMLSLWLAEHQMNAEFTRIFSHVKIDALPLKNINTLIQGNACRIDWNNVCPHTPEEEVFVFGNPPYLGSKLQDKNQKEDIIHVFGNIKNSKNLDYIACWFYLGAKYIQYSTAKFAFVSTNSICQGEQVGIIWPEIFKMNLEIAFAHTSFKWTNNAKEKAGVICVIIGIENISTKKKKIYTGNTSSVTDSINPYLSAGNSVIVTKTHKQPVELPKLCFGAMPYDNGNLILDRFQKEDFISNNPNLAYLVKRLMGSQEFINDLYRYCLWISDDDLTRVKDNPVIAERIRKTKQFRLSSPDKAGKELAVRPHQFREFFPLVKNKIIIPSVSSERREYIPIGFLEKNIVISNSAFALYDAQIWLFGILTSKMHMAWVKAVGGRLKTDYRYSAQLCYNTFPFPKITEAKKKEIEHLAEEVLFTRENHTEKTLAEMYDPNKMPADLRAAHHALDIAVDSCYRNEPFFNDEERLEWLFKLYEKMTKK